MTSSPAPASVRSLDLVVVSYRSRDYLARCLGSMRENGPSCPARIFVVDNDSRDGTVEMVRDTFPEVELIANESNVGFARANNQAIRRGRSSYVLVLNPDTRVTSGCLDRLLDLMDASPRIGVCGCRLEREDGSEDHAAKRGFPTPLGALGHFLGFSGRSWAPSSLTQYRAPNVSAGPVDAVNGAFMLLRRQALEEVGLFDEGYWMYMEDLDLCYRFSKADWTTWYEDSVKAVHVKWGSSGAVRSPRLTWAFHYGMYRFYRLHLAGRRSRALDALVYLGIGVKLLLALASNGMRRALAGAASGGGAASGDEREGR